MQVVVLTKESFDIDVVREGALNATAVGSLMSVLTKNTLYIFHADFLPAMDPVTEHHILELVETGHFKVAEIAEMLGTYRNAVQRVIDPHPHLHRRKRVCG